ncbi:MAG TPA: ABC transporter ATP-binding protein, partial [Chloroflexota bacterium]|nr:ABC transporter ATP-binding protein [Chloroflexota bacterium]
MVTPVQDHAPERVTGASADPRTAPVPASPSSNAAPAIETTELTKSYGKMIAVNHLNLLVERGEIFGFLGPNGAGKTTTMRMLLGLVRPSSGTARVLGMSIDSDLPAILTRTGALIENPTFYPYLSGRDNLRAFARLGGIGEASIPALLDLVDLTKAASRPFSTYSLGMKQRLAVGAALLHRPDLLILDEPANGLDPAGIVEMRDLMKRLKGEGHTVLISSHVLHEIEHICDRIAIMNRGKVVVQGRVSDLLGRGDALEVRVNSLDEAARVLGGAPWVREVTVQADRLVVSAPLASAADLTKLLAGNGLYVSGL